MPVVLPSASDLIMILSMSAPAAVCEHEVGQRGRRARSAPVPWYVLVHRSAIVSLISFILSPWNRMMALRRHRASERAKTRGRQPSRQTHPSSALESFSRSWFDISAVCVRGSLPSQSSVPGVAKSKATRLEVDELLAVPVVDAPVLGLELLLLVLLVIGEGLDLAAEARLLHA